MDALYILRTPLARPDQPHAVLPPGRLRIIGEPTVGQCLVIVGESGVLQTSPVRSFRITDEQIELSTENSRYTLGRGVKAAA